LPWEGFICPPVDYFWALVYVALNAIEGVEQAFYFSMVTFTTLGYGDIVLSECWRLLASFESGIGIIMFGYRLFPGQFFLQKQTVDTILC
jgi:hypothetical protein